MNWGGSFLSYEFVLQIYYYYIHYKSEAQNGNYNKIIPVLIPNFVKIKLNALGGGMFIHPMTCVYYLHLL